MKGDPNLTGIEAAVTASETIRVIHILYENLEDRNAIFDLLDEQYGATRWQSKRSGPTFEGSQGFMIIHVPERICEPISN